MSVPYNGVLWFFQANLGGPHYNSFSRCLYEDPADLFNVEAAELPAPFRRAPRRILNWGF